MTSWTLRQRSSSRTLGQVHTDWAGDLVERCNLPDTLSVKGPLGALRPLLTPGGGCTLEDDDGVRFSGPLTSFTKSGNGTCSATFASDLIWLWGRICYPAPAVAWSAQTADYDVRTGPAETVLLAYVNANAGPGAIAARRVPGLALPASAGRGPTTPITARFDNLGQLVRDLADVAGVRVLVRQDSGTTLQLQVLTTADLSAVARYGTDEGGGPGVLSEDWSFTVSTPGATRALVGGGGEGVLRLLREREDTSAESLWASRTELFVDQRQTSDTGELDQAGDAALDDAANPVTITATLPDADGMRLIQDVPIGSLVALDLDGDLVTDRLRQVTTSITPDGDVRTGVVGSPDSGLTRDQKKFLSLHKAIRKVQAR